MFQPGSGAATFAPNAFIRVGPDNIVTVLSKHIEFGQGPFTGLATLVAEEMANNRFTIRSDKPNVKVSWQVTGIRKDPFAEAHRIRVEEEKPVGERGRCEHDEACSTRP